MAQGGLVVISAVGGGRLLDAHGRGVQQLADDASDGHGDLVLHLDTDLVTEATGQARQLRCCNLIGVVPGADRGLPPLLLAAHYDSVIAAPCADDNAAAVAIARHLAERIGAGRGEGGLGGRLERDLVVALFDAEEPPYFQCPEMGSIRFFNDQMDGRGVHCAVVMDLVGHDLPVEAIGPALMA